ncbi:hypothetical protein DICVIV_06867 [Dictyocaulus viviparus]|uniref:Pseudouridine synthase II N-terminal domain-containing protein n=1 Tax=Dictyocaulus viviparus TaxID=29172 RepID=A0A0D8XQV5_DICVI|nr:hypothetical protein DICVIV_06867 [Dictyocaulus viviparus]
MKNKLWKALNGLVCAYKPVDLSVAALKRQIVRRICADGNEVVGSPRLPLIKLPIVEPHEKTGALVVNIRCFIAVFALNDECEKIPEILAHSWVNVYRLDGILGRETDKHNIKGRVISKVDYDHVTRHKLQKLIARIQSEYRKLSFKAAEVDLQSEDAFELARKGTPRVQLPEMQIVYDCSVKHFSPPFFSLQVQCVGETDLFLRCFIHEIGANLGTTASCSRLRRCSIGPFQSSHTLLEKQISLQNIIRNIELCRRILGSLPKDEGVVCENSSPYEETRDVVDGLNLHVDDEYDAMRPVWPRNYT